MLDYDELFELPPFSLDGGEKEILKNKWVYDLSIHHQDCCSEYAALANRLGLGFPLPVRLFKEYDLRSIGLEDVAKTMTSSGTTGQQVSRIYLDKATSARQSKALARIMASFVGKSRAPLLIIDSPNVIKDRSMFSARGAGILGFSMLGRDVTYALDENMALDIEAIEGFYQRHRDETVMLFGFTFIIWEHFCQELLKKNIQLDLSGVLIHGGGWKKLADQAVDNETFKKIVRKVCGLGHVHNYYGMVEQTGSICVECEEGNLHVSAFSDIEIVDPFTLDPQVSGKGLIVITSFLPTSYPGHVLLTEDEGELLGVDDCSCGRKGKYFKVYGRIQGAEIRGCSDTYEKH